MSCDLGNWIRDIPQELSFPANTRHWAIVSLMLVHRLRRCPNIQPTMTRVSCLLASFWRDIALLLSEGNVKQYSFTEFEIWWLYTKFWYKYFLMYNL